MTNENIHDQAFKELIQECFKEFMELFWPEESKQIDFRTIHYLQQEMSTDHGPGKGNERKMDVVAEVRIKGELRHILIHIEHQNKRENAFPKRMFNYYCQLWLRHQKPIFPIALFSDDHIWRKPIDDFFEIEALGRKTILFNYELIKLKNLNWRDFIGSNNPIVAALMTKMGYTKEEIPRVKAQIARILTGREVRFHKLGYLADFAEFYMPLEEKKYILEYKAELKKLGIKKDITEMLILSKPFKEKFEAAKKEGLKKGIEQGIEQGLEQGIERGLEQGIEQGIEKAHFNNASKMLDKGLNWKLIEEITGLTRQKFQKLKKKYS